MPQRTYQPTMVSTVVSKWCERFRPSTVCGASLSVLGVVALATRGLLPVVLPAGEPGAFSAGRRRARRTCLWCPLTKTPSRFGSAPSNAPFKNSPAMRMAPSACCLRFRSEGKMSGFSPAGLSSIQNWLVRVYPGFKL